MSITKDDCLTCGLCCVSTTDQASFCDVTKKDVERLDKALGTRWVARNVTSGSTLDALAAMVSGRVSVVAIKTKWREQRSGPLKGFHCCTCVALKGTLLKKVECSIYEVRPHSCRAAVKPGDRTCKQLRRLYSDIEGR